MSALPSSLLSRAVSHGVLLMSYLQKAAVCSPEHSVCYHVAPWTGGSLELLHGLCHPDYNWLSHPWEIPPHLYVDEPEEHDRLWRKLLLTCFKKLFGLLSSHCVILSATIKESGVFHKKLHSDLKISSRNQFLKRFSSSSSPYWVLQSKYTFDSCWPFLWSWLTGSTSSLLQIS